MIDKETIELILAKTIKRNVKKGELLLRKGEASSNLFLVVEGCLRSYFVDKKGKEHIIQFAPEGCTIGDYESIIKDSPALLNIEALEDGIVHIFSKKDTEKILGSKTELIKIENKLYHDQVITLQKRVIQLLSGTADERYIEFTKVFPNLLNRLSQKMIASYLGIAPESLSRVRNEIVKRK